MKWSPTACHRSWKAFDPGNGKRVVSVSHRTVKISLCWLTSPVIDCAPLPRSSRKKCPTDVSEFSLATSKFQSVSSRLPETRGLSSQLTNNHGPKWKWIIKGYIFPTARQSGLNTLHFPLQRVEYCLSMYYLNCIASDPNFPIQGGGEGELQNNNSVQLNVNIDDPKINTFNVTPFKGLIKISNSQQSCQQLFFLLYFKLCLKEFAQIHFQI